MTRLVGRPDTWQRDYPVTNDIFTLDPKAENQSAAHALDIGDRKVLPGFGNEARVCCLRRFLDCP